MKQWQGTQEQFQKSGLNDAKGLKGRVRNQIIVRQIGAGILLSVRNNRKRGQDI